MMAAADTEQNEIAVQGNPRPQAVFVKRSLILGALTLIAAGFVIAGLFSGITAFSGFGGGC